MGHSRDYLARIAQILEQSHLIAQMTEEMIERACAELRRATWCEAISGIFLILRVWLPEKCLWFDAELDNVGEAAEIVRMYARATDGEWRDPQARATGLPERVDGRWEALDFLCQGNAYHWEFHTADAQHRGKGWEWGAQFALQLGEVVKTHLTGAFFEPWLGDQSGYACYLPRNVAEAYTALQEQLEASFGWDGFEKFVQEL